eukprot:2733147-Rhodomonas_salina.1
MEFVNCNYNPFVPGQEDNPDNQAFQWIVIALAIDAGALQALPKIDNPLENACHCSKNFRYILEAVAGFSSQLNSKCSVAFPQLFRHEDPNETPHCLSGLREFVSLHCIFQRDDAVGENASTAWEMAFACLRSPVEATNASITAWMNNMDSAIQKLNTARVDPQAIDGTICGNVISKLGELTAPEGSH